MSSYCPRCRSWADSAPVGPAGGPCPACGASPGPPPIDIGLTLENGVTACPAAFGPYRVLGCDRAGRDGGRLSRPSPGDRRGGGDQDGPAPEARALAAHPPRGPRPGPDSPPGAGPDHPDRAIRRAPLVRDGTPPGDDAPRRPPPGGSRDPVRGVRDQRGAGHPARLRSGIRRPDRAHPSPSMANATTATRPAPPMARRGSRARPTPAGTGPRPPAGPRRPTSSTLRRSSPTAPKAPGGPPRPPPGGCSTRPITCRSRLASGRGSSP